MAAKEILFLTNNEQSLSLAQWLASQGSNVTIWKEKLSTDDIDKLSPDLLVSYNYSHIIKKDVLDMMVGRALNMHISYLPWNKGADPNFWSFVEDTPKGITIHEITPELDGGGIIYQQEWFYNPDTETFASTYQGLQYAIQALFKKNWDKIMNYKFSATAQIGGG